MKHSRKSVHAAVGNCQDAIIQTESISCIVNEEKIPCTSESSQKPRAENPNLSFAEIDEMLDSEWYSLSTNKHEQYLDADERDRERYARECTACKQTDAYTLFTQQQNEKETEEIKEKEEAVAAPTPVSTDSQPVINKDPQEMDFDIPIFTEEFLNHNKTRNAELRQLRQVNSDYEQQNAILSKHVETINTVITKLEEKILQQEKSNASIRQDLSDLRNTLTVLAE